MRWLLYMQPCCPGMHMHARCPYPQSWLQMTHGSASSCLQALLYKVLRGLHDVSQWASELRSKPDEHDVRLSFISVNRQNDTIALVFEMQAGPRPCRCKASTTLHGILHTSYCLSEDVI